MTIQNIGRDVHGHAVIPAILSVLILALIKGLRKTPHISHSDIVSSLSYVQIGHRQTSVLMTSFLGIVLAVPPIKKPIKRH